MKQLSFWTLLSAAVSAGLFWWWYSAEAINKTVVMLNIASTLVTVVLCIGLAKVFLLRLFNGNDASEDVAWEEPIVCETLHNAKLTVAGLAFGAAIITVMKLFD